MIGALSKVRVLDLTQMMAGPYCTMMLADQGADVIKIEAPSGEVARGYGPFLDDDADRHYGGYFQSINRNKRSIVIDLKSDQGKDVFRRLVRDADVVVENFRAGVMDRLGLSYESLNIINPKLVYATIRGFGDPRTGASPYQDWPAYDIVAQAMGGIMHMTGPVEGPPTKVGPGVGDTVAAMIRASSSTSPWSMPSMPFASAPQRPMATAWATPMPQATIIRFLYPSAPFRAGMAGSPWAALSTSSG
jgi:crotonobetainyl-CoA:carnitine CoA-transferase CaiB-like acyl-CoA transferase